MLEARRSEHCQQLRVFLTPRNGKHNFHLSGVATKQQRLNSWMLPFSNHNKRMIIRYEMIVLSRNYLWEYNIIHFFWKHSYNQGLICDKTGRNAVPASFYSVPVYCSYIIQSVTLKYYNSEETDIAVMFQICIREMPGSNLMYEAFRGSPQSLQANSGILPGLGQHRFLPNLLQFIIHQ
jgi:hypothetical protein